MARRARTMSSPEAPRLEDELEPRTLEVADLDPGATVERARIAGAELAGVRAQGVAIAAARLLDVELAGARLDGLRLLDVAVERGNLANLVASEVSLRRVTIMGTRLTGATWTRGWIADTAFRDCRIDLASFAGTTLERTTFEGCRLVQADFRDALWRSVRFDHCDLAEADLTGVRLENCELRGCRLDGLTGIERLRGAALPWADVVGHAGLMAAALGIRTLGEEER